MSPAARAAALGALALALGCGEPSAPAGDAAVATPDATAAPDAAPDAGPASLAWEPCPLRSDGAGTGADCAEVEAPVRWSDPAGPTLTLFVKRLPAQQLATGQLWFLNGGPGGSGAEFEPFAEALAPYYPSLDFYMLDHRGTGRSSRLGCPAEEADDSEGGLLVTDAEWPACAAAAEAEWGAALAGFTTTDAAHDVGWLIERTRVPGMRVHVMGGSYGTFWAQRYLQLFPDQPTAVTLIGIAPPTISFTDYDYWFNEVGKAYLAACAADPFCAGKLGPDPAARVMDLYARLDGGHCPEAVAAGLDRSALRQLFAQLIFFYWEERALVPALIYRLDRCAAGDVAALQTFAAAVFAPATPTIYDRFQGQVLGRHIGLSELWTEPSPELAELQAVIDGAAFSTELGAHFAPLHEYWPRYTPDALDGAWAETDVPLLMMNGTLDPATPLALADAVGAHFAGPNQTYVALPGAPHSWSAPTPAGSCSILMFMDFLESAAAPPSSACAAQIEPLSFTGSAELAAGAFGTTDLWENAGGKPAVAGEAAGARLLGLMARAQRRRF